MELRDIVPRLRDNIEAYRLYRDRGQTDDALQFADEIMNLVDTLDSWLDSHGVLPEDLRDTSPRYGYGPVIKQNED